MVCFWIVAEAGVDVVFCLLWMQQCSQDEYTMCGFCFSPLCFLVFHLWSCPEEEKMNESDEDRRISEAKASRIQKCQGAVPFLPLWELLHPEGSGWTNNTSIWVCGFRVAQEAESQQRKLGRSDYLMWVSWRRNHSIFFFFNYHEYKKKREGNG